MIKNIIFDLGNVIINYDQQKIIDRFAKNDEEKEESLKALKSSAGFIRREVGNRVKLRSTPEILFEEDNSIDNAMYIESLLNKIKEK